jgi:nitrogenase molybdenum-cofactor synthesis protein NifE
VLVDDTNPIELARFVSELEVDIFIGGVKERPIAYKLGVAFCDHNHERKIALAGFEGMLNFAREVHASLSSPVFEFSPVHEERRRRRAAAAAARAGEEDRRRLRVVHEEPVVREEEEAAC